MGTFSSRAVLFTLPLVALVSSSPNPIASSTVDIYSPVVSETMVSQIISSFTPTTLQLVASSSPIPYTWIPVGCYNDDGPYHQKALDGVEWWPDAISMTIEACHSYCMELDYIYSGVEYGQQYVVCSPDQ